MLPVPPLRTRTKSKIQMRTHMGEMSYKCSQCKYTCTRVTNLHTHMLTHTEVRAFNCDQCNKYSHEKVIFIKHSLSQAQRYEHKEPTFLNMRSPWFDYQQIICHALCRQQCRLTICIELDELTNSEAAAATAFTFLSTFFLK